MNVALRDKENLVVSLTEANRVLESDLRGMQELYKNQQQEWRQAMETSKYMITIVKLLKLKRYNKKCI